MNAGTVKCRCGVHYTARDPHPLCRNCSPRNCSRSQPCGFCLPWSITEWDLWLDQEAKTIAYCSKRGSAGSSSPATEGIGLPQDTNVPNMSDSVESTGNFETVSSGEDYHLASHSGRDARLTNLETGLSSLQASLVNISSLLTSRFGPSLGTETKETSLSLGMPSGLEGVPFSSVRPLSCDRDKRDLTIPGYAFRLGRGAIFRDITSNVSTAGDPPVVLPSGMPASLGSQSQSSSQHDFLSLPSFQPNGPGRSSGEQRVYPTEVEVIIENSQVAERPLDVSMEEDLGSEEQVLSTNSTPPPLRGRNRDPRSLSLGVPAFMC